MDLTLLLSSEMSTDIFPVGQPQTAHYEFIIDSQKFQSRRKSANFQQNI
jgi:hypothetical protein